MGFHYYFAVIIPVTLVRQLRSFSQTLFYKDIILNIQARLSWASASQELSVGTLPLKKPPIYKGGYQKYTSFHPCPTGLHRKREHQLFFSWRIRVTWGNLSSCFYMDN